MYVITWLSEVATRPSLTATHHQTRHGNGNYCGFNYFLILTESLILQRGGRLSRCISSGFQDWSLGLLAGWSWGQGSRQHTFVFSKWKQIDHGNQKKIRHDVNNLTWNSKDLTWKSWLDLKIPPKKRLQIELIYFNVFIREIKATARTHTCVGLWSGEGLQGEDATLSPFLLFHKVLGLEPKRS